MGARTLRFVTALLLAAALAAMMASRSEQSPGAQLPSFSSLVTSTVKSVAYARGDAADTALVYNQPRRLASISASSRSNMAAMSAARAGIDSIRL